MIRTSFAVLALSSAVLMLGTGCGGSSLVPAAAVPAPVIQSAGLAGHVHGGQQPVVGATIQLYKANTTGYGVASTALLTSTVKTTAGGAFNITDTISCAAADQLYLVATGGDPSGAGGTNNNSALALMTGLGRCDSLTSSSFVAINEVTTVATAYALSPFMSSLTQVSTSPTNITGLNNAFAAIAELVNPATGLMPGPSLPAGAVFSTAQINTLADVLAVCVNTIDAGAAQSAACANLFGIAKPSAAAPTNTVQAMLNLAQHPTLGLTLGGTAPAVSPFQPTLGSATPTDWTLAITYSGGGLSSPSALAADAAGNVWVANATNSVSRLNSLGAAVSGPGGYTDAGLSGPVAVAIDGNGSAWVANISGSVTRFNGSTGTSFPGGGASTATGIAIDAAQNVWVSGSGAAKVSEFSNSGVLLSGAGYSVSSGSTAIAINPK